VLQVVLPASKRKVSSVQKRAEGREQGHGVQDGRGRRVPAVGRSHDKGCALRPLPKRIIATSNLADWRMISDREALIAKLSVGDMFHASFSNKAARICIVTSMSDTALIARAVTTQEIFSFNRIFGTAESMEGAVCTIDSVYPLSREIRDVLLELDRRYGGEPGLDGGPLSGTERDALLDAGALYSAHPMPR
jgi:hypothetical protein